ncbi:MAG: hypothetical protein JOZ29_04360 [Deltaproteobacteria bacterium]|nr:hypothetical protein [Deltaproteobacteria bacterium]
MFSSTAEAKESLGQTVAWMRGGSATGQVFPTLREPSSVEASLAEVRIGAVVEMLVVGAATGVST